jgi:hypothetical protein
MRQIFLLHRYSIDDRLARHDLPDLDVGQPDHFPEEVPAATD